MLISYHPSQILEKLHLWVSRPRDLSKDLLNDIFNGLIECGFIIEKVQEMPPDLYQNGTPKEESWEHYLKYSPDLFAILARKK
ncbi:hypothetical protein HZA38_03525 [Candidatus Peregrinibacteria bacterium]|nr:hypothetical protein [Candidatus Peregrinibacteria bacterium]